MSENFFTQVISADAPRDRVFIRSDAEVLSYGALFDQSARYAHALRQLGVEVGDRVAVQVDKSPQAICLYLAALRLGAVYLPLNTAYTAAELEYFFADAEPALVVCASARRELIGGLCARLGVAAVESLDADGSGSLTARAATQPPEFSDVERGRDDLAAILYTSGTTGRSKGAMLTHGNLSSNARALAQLWRFTDADVLLHALPIFHIHGLFVATNVTLVARAAMIFLPRFEVDTVLRHLRDATVMMGVPTFYVRLLKDARLNRDLVAPVRVFISGSAPLLVETHREWLQRTGQAILERYGMSETGMNTSNPYDGERVPGSVGPPLPGVSVRITEPASGTVLASESIGMIEVKGPNICRGYWRNPAKTKAEFRADGYFITGDIGKIDARGYVYIVGRNKDLIITGGYNVYPLEVEDEINAVPGVAESAVIGVAHPDFGEGVTAVVVVPATAQLTEAAVLARLKERLAGYKIPKRVLFVDDLPRNKMVKVQKNVLRERYAQLYNQSRGSSQ